MRVAPTLLFAAAMVLLSIPSLMGQPPMPPAPAETPPDTTASDEKILRDVREPVDGPALLDYFRKRTYPEADPKTLEKLIRELGAPSFRVREKAFTDLIALGSSSMVAVRQAEGSAEHEILRRAANIRKQIEERADPVVQAATARLIAVRKPAGAAEVLLNYLPYAADGSVVEEICSTLPKVILRDGKPEPVVLAALKDKVAVKRGAAAAALVQAGVNSELPAVRALLKDSDPGVQLRIALALVREKREKDAVPTLISTLEHLPQEQLWPAEELLIRIAGEKAPQVSLGLDAASRAKCRQVWAEWWDKNKDVVALDKVELNRAFLGYTLVVERTFNRIVNGKRLPATGQVCELDANKKVRWKIEINTYPVDAEVTGPDRVLITEFQGQRVTERDFKGNIKWERRVNGNPLSAHRLPGGNTFIVMQNRLAEYNPKGEEVWHMDRQNFDIFRGRKLRNGEVVFITNAGLLTRLDPKTQKVVGSFQVGPMGSQFGNFELLPSGNFLVPVYNSQQVIEFDPTGKQVWQAKVQWPTSVQRLPNNNTLVGSQISRRVVEIDRNGDQRWDHGAEGQVFMARRR
ncbi:MAG TPA: PQQ-binding-like beta-propeller repeat protein [Gemmataceae bacterium]|nr:PQQ-binding-like beta-propeller repeat protein [Gemmataceae bacterium]